MDVPSSNSQQAGLPTPPPGLLNSPRIQVSLPTSLKVMPPRSPSRESVANTEMSASSGLLLAADGSGGWTGSNKLPAAAHLSFVLKAVPENQQLSAYNCCLTPNRGPSPIPGGGSGRFLKVPGAASAGLSSAGAYPWEEEMSDLNVIKSCAALSKALGLQKSFSTGDILSSLAGGGGSGGEDPVSSPDAHQFHTGNGTLLRSCVSEMALGVVQLQCERMGGGCAGMGLMIGGMGSRSLSTWVAVGDGATAGAAQQISSQLPSPQGRPASVHVDSKSAQDFMAASFNISAADLILNLNKRVRQCYIRRRLVTTYKALERLSQSQFNLDRIAQQAQSQTTDRADPLPLPAPLGGVQQQQQILTLNDVERDQGRPLSKYTRNMMIFNWLHSLDPEESPPGGAGQPPYPAEVL